MAQIATNNRQITLFCIAESNRAKQTLAYSKAEGLSVLVIDIKKTPLTGSQIIEISRRLNMEVIDLIIEDSDIFNPKIDLPNLSTDDWIKMIRRNPEILKQPIALRGNKTKLIETPSNIIQL